MPGLVWNTMLSMSGGWFFVVASEAITLGDNTWKLPGIGSYVAQALEKRDLGAVGWAIVAMLGVILLYDQVLFRPLVAWSAKFRFEVTAGAVAADPGCCKLLRRTRVLRLAGRRRCGCRGTARGAAPGRRLAAASPPRPSGARGSAMPRSSRSWGWSRCWRWWRVVDYIAANNIGWTDVAEAVGLGCITLLRVVVLMALATLVWVPVGVWIGLRPAWARRIQVAAQFLAAFPANLLFPIFVVLIVRFHLDADIWLTPLMILGTQWYILFNVVAGASAFPGDLQEAADNLRVARLAVVAARDPARHLPVLCHRRDHRLRRLVERVDRRRGRVLGQRQARRARPRRLHRPGDRRRRLSAHRAGSGGDVGVRARASTACCGGRSTPTPRGA